MFGKTTPGPNLPGNQLVQVAPRSIESYKTLDLARLVTSHSFRFDCNEGGRGSSHCTRRSDSEARHEKRGEPVTLAPSTNMCVYLRDAAERVKNRESGFGINTVNSK